MISHALMVTNYSSSANESANSFRSCAYCFTVSNLVPSLDISLYFSTCARNSRNIFANLLDPIHNFSNYSTYSTEPNSPLSLSHAASRPSNLYLLEKGLDLVIVVFIVWLHVGHGVDHADCYSQESGQENELVHLYVNPVVNELFVLIMINGELDEVWYSLSGQLSFMHLSNFCCV